MAGDNPDPPDNFGQVSNPFEYPDPPGNTNTLFLYDYGTDGSNGGNENSTCTNSPGSAGHSSPGQEIEFTIVNAKTKSQVGAQSNGGDGGNGGNGDCKSGRGGTSGSGPGNVNVILKSDVEISNSTNFVEVQIDTDGDGETETYYYALGAISSGRAGNGGDGGNSTYSNGGDGGQGGTTADQAADGLPSVNLTAEKGVRIVINPEDNNQGIGLLGQSTGGQGGDGGNGGTFGHSGDGNDGGYAGPVVVNNLGNIELHLSQNEASSGGAGILVQSVGGQGGGAGSSGISLVTYGNTGGSGGPGEDVSVTHQGIIITSGTAAIGINAQSVGGGGGSVPASTSLLTVGGSEGGLGGDASNSMVEVDGGTVRTDGDHAAGVLVQSIGGGGGSVGGQTSLNTVGSSGGDGGKGATAKIVLENNAVITTGLSSQSDSTPEIGQFSPGVLVQSIGGGGGNAGTNSGVIAVGSDGGAGGDGGPVVGELGASSIRTFRLFSPALLMQSIGGGGGNGGDTSSASVGTVSVGGSEGGDGGAGGQGGDVTITPVPGLSAIQTKAGFSGGLLLQTIGGGGGHGGSASSMSAGVDGSVSVAVGGSGGDGGAAGSVSIGNSNESFSSLITTKGIFSPGISVSAVGGGGGDGGSASSMSAAASGSVSVAVGGSAGDGGDGGSISSFVQGSIATSGFQSPALSFRSIGGGGGSGGSSTSSSAAVGISGSLAVGGTGGGGGSGQSIESSYVGGLSTTGNFSPGINLNNIGGGGGDGGNSTSLSAGGAASAAPSIGGTGGDGGSAGTSTLDFSGRSITEGMYSPGLVVRSIGGGGGSGGTALSGSASFAASAATAVGGSGSNAGHGGVISAAITNSTITTSSLHSPAILLQSIGGGGGSGGAAVSGSAVISPAAGANASVAIGGSGADGGSGGSLDLDFSGQLQTGADNADRSLINGAFSSAILAQSIGGGGGHGGVSVAAGASISAGSDLNGTVSIGGNGGDGGDGGDVNFNSISFDEITTFGRFSSAIHAQSIGGGGGNGGSSYSLSLSASGGSGLNGSVALGGNAGDGGDGGSINFAGSGDSIFTIKDFSSGTLLQSIGGGGGAGGTAINLSASVGTNALNAGVAVGGTGGKGGKAGDVTLAMDTSVHTLGHHSAGLAIQSLGGGGGMGGTSFAASITGSTKNSLNAVASVGGDGSDGGDGGEINLDSSGHDLTTSGLFSPTILAQSIGGGGGSGGNATNLQATFSGAKGYTIGPAIGGQAGSAGDGGSITLENQSSLQNGAPDNSEIISHFSPGVIAQSIGGGGGSGGSSLSGSITLNLSQGDSDSQTSAADLGASIGGNGGGGGHGGAIAINNLGGQQTTTTTGHFSGGLIGQSIGGGGGHGGSSQTASLSLTTKSQISSAVSIGGKGQSGGDGGRISIVNQQAISTGSGQKGRISGHFSPGILAQSIGAGGGAGGSSLNTTLTASNLDPDASQGEESMALIGSAAVGGDGGGAGDGGAITITNQAPLIETRGDFSAGVQVQSIGGGGGSGGNATTKVGNIGSSSSTGNVAIGGNAGGGGDGGVVSVNNEAAIRTGAEKTLLPRGSFSPGLIAQSIGGGGGLGGNATTDQTVINTSIKSDDDSTSFYSLGISLGGKGGVGGNGDSVTITTSHPLIQTNGAFSSGVVAQSIGGGGGSGGNSTLINRTFSYGANAISGGLSLGGEGGKGGIGGDVSVDLDAVTSNNSESTNEILTSGAFAYGVLAQSIGGGGGAGGSAVTTSESTTKTGNPSDVNRSGALLIGGVLGQDWGSGGKGASGGAININGGANVLTSGAGSSGLVVQSIGGGGGVGGDVTSTLNSSADDNSSNQGFITMSLGGDGGSGQSGGDVTWTSENSQRFTLATEGIHAYGALLQSIGAGGGAGGSSTQNADITSESTYSFGSISSIGGSAGHAADGGKIHIGTAANQLRTQIETQGTGSAGLVAQSIGGGGGAGGGSATEASITSAYGDALSFGGSGGGGGSGGSLEVRARGTITTAGFQAPGVVLQSIGGGGGLGGSSISTSATSLPKSSDDESTSLSFGSSEAGQGGGGGDGGIIISSLSGTVVTRRAGSDGLLVQSIGGGGGSGGTTKTTTSLQEGSGWGSLPVSLSFGAGGGNGGKGGAISLRSALGLKVGTEGNNAHGITVQSIGGGGGRGGAVSSLASNGSDTDITLGASIGIGASGGGGGRGGDLSIGDDDRSLSLTVQTRGINSPALQLQSIGGGGGSGSSSTSGSTSGSLATSISLGGQGGAGGDAGSVNLIADLDVVSNGPSSKGALLQSIGGGGGQGGVVSSNVSATALSAESDISLGISVAVGGKGGAGADADSVTADLSGSVTTYGDYSSGLTLQSIGGGGGSAGRVISSSEASESDLNVGVTVALGAQGGQGADAGQIALQTSAIDRLNVSTEGAISPAILLQSIGGGGGQSSVVNSVASAIDSDNSLGAGFSKTGSAGGGGDGASVDVNLKQLRLLTSGPVSTGLTVQSIGGGGGSAGTVSSSLGKAEIGFAATLGGGGGSGGDGGRIKINTGLGQIVTAGAASNAVLAQSIGGGGGQASQVKTGRSAADTTMTGALGGSGGDGGKGQLVSIENNTSLMTTGNNSAGLFVQSIGGGGGSSNMSLAKDRSYGSFQGHIQVGATAGAGGDGGPVNLDNYSTVKTLGEQAHSIFAQSIGGGGGRVAFQAGRSETESQMSLNFGGTAGSGGDGKAIDIYNSGIIIATGNSSYGIYSQSLGGGGGSLSSTAPVSISLGATGGDGGDGGAIAITNSKDASITTSGENGVGILALSLGGGGGDVAVTQADVTLGSSGGTGGSGGNILIVNKGVITTSADGGVGIYAKSIGGGGGRVTDSINSGELQLGSEDVDVSDGGEVEVLNRGSITSIGPNSVPIQLSNLGGGGGDARDGYGQGQLGSIRSSGSSGISKLTNLGSASSFGSSSPAVFQQSIGGGGGSVNSLNGDARLGSIAADSAQNTRSLTLINAGNISTRAEFSPGMLAQAIGGGGGRVNIVSGNAFLGSQEIAQAANLSSGSIDIESIGDQILTLGDISPGIVAQSIGGGGGWVGIVGENLNMGVEKASGLLRSSLVKVNNQSDILTTGRNSAGMILQSIGGGGGLSSYAGGSIYLGSQDGEGVLSSGGMVVDNDAEIRTIDDSSAGIAALTIGGGGGFISGSNNKVADLIRLGGSGNQIGISKISEVRVSKNSVISTKGLNSPGVLAQSVGGGGGYTNQSSKVASLGQIGGFGEGGDVSVINHGRISTGGRRSIGVVAQSIGAGGGTADESTERLWMGARGGARGSAGNVSVKNTKGVITTSGNHSIAVVAQSVGGGGGRLSTASGDVQLGASGGSGDGGEVTLANIDGIISTTGAFSPPYLMQSVGGGGGHVASAGDVMAIDTTVMLGGGIHGTEGNGGQLKLLNYSGVIESQGKFSPGVIHQSIGGGGGWLGDMPAGTLSMGGLTTGPSSGSDLNLRLPLSVQTGAAHSPGVLVQSLGAGGGVAGRVFNQASLGGNLQESVIGDAGSIVYSSNDLPIMTIGDESPGVILQSIGGGGGWIGSVGEDVDMGARMQENSSAEGSNISAISNSIVLTRGKHSPAFVAQTIGGGGGYAQLAESVDFGVSDGLGASLSASTASGDIAFVNNGSLRTKGLNSFGVMLQSVAGGGGISGSESGQVSLADGNDSSSGDIEFTNLGTIETTGVGAHAVVLQSISGGGGYVFGGTNIDAFPQGENRPSGRSGDITIRNSGDIFANGLNSIGVFANTATNGAFVYQNPDGTIGQQIQNISDGDEFAGQVRITNSGQIVASGVGGIGITKSTNLKQSHGNLYVENLQGALIQGGPNGAAIQLPTDETETVVNKGMIIGGPLGQDPAIRGIRGNDLVENYSLIAGDINIPGGRTQVFNHEGARIEANQIVLDARSSFINEGLLSPNGAHRLGEVAIAAKYIQPKSGNYVADLEVSTGETDYLNLLFASALDGNIVLVPTKTGQAIPGSFMSNDILEAGAMPYDSLDFVYPESAVASYALVPGSQPESSLAFEYDVDFSPSGLDPNSKAVGDAVNKIQLAGSTSPEQRLFTAYAYSLPTVSKLNEAYRQVSGEQNIAFSQSILQVTSNFLDTVQGNIRDVNLDSYNSCGVLTDSGAQVGESAAQVAPCPRWRAWFETGSYQSSTPGQGSSKQSDFAINSFNSTLGVDALLSENTSVGIAGQFSKIWTNTYNLSASGSANLWNGLAYAKQKIGSNTFLTAQFGAGSSQTDIDRYVSLPISTTESSKADAWNLMGRLQLSHDIETNKNGGLLKPSIGISYLVNSQSAYEESTDASSVGWRPDSNRFDNSLDLLEPSHSLKYSSQSYTSIPLELKLDLKHPFAIGDVDLVSRIDVGYGFDLGDTSREITAEFANAPGPTFTVTGTPAPSSWWDLGLALDVHFDERFMIYLNGRTQLAVGGTQSINYGGGFRFRF